MAIERELARFERLDAALTAIQSVEAAGGTAHYHSVDLTDAEAVAAVIDDVRARSGRIDVLLHAAGLEISRNLPDKEPREFDLVFDVKSDGWFNLLHAARDMPIGATVVFSLGRRTLRQRGPDRLRRRQRPALQDHAAASAAPGRRPGASRSTGRPGAASAWRPAARSRRSWRWPASHMLPPEAGVAWIRRELTSGGDRGEVVVAGALGMMAADTTTGRRRLAGAGRRRGRPRPDDRARRRSSVHDGVVGRDDARPDRSSRSSTTTASTARRCCPGVMGMEAFAEAARLLAPDATCVAVEDVTFAAPLKFYRDEPRTLTVQAVVRPDGDDLVADCRSSAERHAARHDEPQRTVHFTGRVRLTQPRAMRGTDAPPGDPSGPTLDADRSTRSTSTDPPTRWWRRLAGGRRAVGGARRSAARQPRAGRAAALTAPRLVELCFQTAGLWQAGREDRLALPMRVGRAYGFAVGDEDRTTTPGTRP